MRVFKTGKRLLEPSVYETIHPSGVVVVKDYSRYRSHPLSAMARFLVRHEHAILSLLQGLAPHAWVEDPYILTMERVEGCPLRPNEDPSVLNSLTAAIQAMHARLVVHNDLHASNIIVVGQRVVLLDMASAMHGKLITALLRNRDVANTIKIKFRANPACVSATERQHLDKPLWAKAVQALWQTLYRPLKRFS